jgi:hypothetical protein
MSGPSKGRVSYSQAGAAGRAAFEKANKCWPALTEAQRKVLEAVVSLTALYSKLQSRETVGQVAQQADVHRTTAQRALQRLADSDIIIYRPSRTRGQTLIGLPHVATYRYNLGDRESTPHVATSGHSTCGDITQHTREASPEEASHLNALDREEAFNGGEGSALGASPSPVAVGGGGGNTSSAAASGPPSPTTTPNEASDSSSVAGSSLASEEAARVVMASRDCCYCGNPQTVRNGDRWICRKHLEQGL